MFGLFKHRTWQIQSAARLEGSFNGIRVVLNNFPYCLDAQSGRRRLPANDFANRFLTQLTERELPRFEEIFSSLNAGRAIEVQVQVNDHHPIGVTINGNAPNVSREFYSDLADALLQAFKTEDIR